MKGPISTLVVIAFIGVVRSQFGELNCDLKNGFGCSVNDQFYRMTYTGDSLGSSSDCRRTYQLEINLFRPFNGFYCYFLTNNPSQGRFVYTVSHNENNFKDDRTAWIRARGANVKIEPEVAFSEPERDNFWSYRNFHSLAGQSFSYFEFTRDKLSYFSDNLRHTASVGHRNLFEPARRTVYMGLNRKYENRQGRGTGLCQIACSVFADFSASPLGAARSASQSSVRGRAASPGDADFDADDEIRLSGPPPVPTSDPTQGPSTQPSRTTTTSRPAPSSRRPFPGRRFF